MTHTIPIQFEGGVQKNPMKKTTAAALARQPSQTDSSIRRSAFAQRALHAISATMERTRTDDETSQHPTQSENKELGTRRTQKNHAQNPNKN